MASTSVRAVPAERRRARALPRVIRADNGMNILGQGSWILLFTAPAVAAALAALHLAPDLVRIPLPGSALTPLGVAIAAPGAALWLTAMVQLEYRRYTQRVHRIVPFVRPGASAG